MTAGAYLGPSLACERDQAFKEAPAAFTTARPRSVTGYAVPPIGGSADEPRTREINQTSVNGLRRHGYARRYFDRHEGPWVRLAVLPVGHHGCGRGREYAERPWRQVVHSPER